MAARLGDSTAHGGVIVVGWPTVMIGESGSGGGGGGGGAPAAGPGGSGGAGGGSGGGGKGGGTGAAHPGPPAKAFRNAAKSGSPTVCKGPCEAGKTL